MSSLMPAAEMPRRIVEEKTIQPIPETEKHGKPRDLLTIWLGSNITVLAVVNGALATTLYGQPFWLAVLGLVIGNLLGATFMALHAVQGARLGVPQLIQTRGQFGSYGALLVIAAVATMYVGFLAENLLLAGQSLNLISSHISTGTGIIAVGAVSAVVTIFGYDVIHAYARLMCYAAGAALLLTFIFAVHHLSAGLGQAGSPGIAGFMGTVTVAALWQIAYAPYVSDYSRYLPADTAGRPAFWATYTGSSLGSVLPMILGAMIGTASSDVLRTLATLTHGVGGVIIVMFTVCIAMASALNIYSGALSVLTIGQTFVPRWRPRAISRAACTVVIVALAAVPAIMSQNGFLVSFTNLTLLLMYVVVPWTAINLIDFYLIRHGAYDVAQFFRGDGGGYGRFNLVAVGCYLAGVAVEVPFVNTGLFEGPVATALGGVDLSWLVCLLVVAPLYYVLASRGQRTETLEPEPAELAAG